MFEIEVDQHHSVCELRLIVQTVDLMSVLREPGDVGVWVILWLVECFCIFV